MNCEHWREEKQNSGDAELGSKASSYQLTEIIGCVEEVREDEVILSFTRQRCVVPIRSDELLKWRNHLKVSSHVAILLLDDGSIRVRGL